MAFRRLVETHSVHFWGSVAKWLSGGLWRLILCIFPVRPQGPGFSLSLRLEGEFKGKP